MNSLINNEFLESLLNTGFVCLKVITYQKPYHDALQCINETRIAAFVREL